MRLEIEPYAVIEPPSSDSGLKFRIFVKSSANEIKTELRQISGRDVGYHMNHFVFTYLAVQGTAISTGLNYKIVS